MSRVKGKDTKPEIFIRSLLHKLGFRFTVNGPKNRKLPGKPDIVLPKYNTVVFVHGCFWHGHPGCKDHRIPKTRSEWWKAKIESTRLRDQTNIEKLRALGWRVVVLWTCQFDTSPKRARLAETLSHLITPEDCRAMTLIAAEEKAPYRKRIRNGKGPSISHELDWRDEAASPATRINTAPAICPCRSGPWTVTRPMPWPT